MNHKIELEVFETIDDYKELLKKQHTFISLLLILIAILIVMSGGKIFQLNNFTSKSKIMIIIGMIFYLVGTSISVNYFLINSFKKGVKNNPELFHYHIDFYKDQIIIKRGENITCEYNKIKIKQNKKCYFLYYYSKNGKNVSIINKEKCQEEALKVLEKHI